MPADLPPEARQLFADARQATAGGDVGALVAALEGLALTVAEVVAELRNPDRSHFVSRDPSPPPALKIVAEYLDPPVSEPPR